MGTAGVPVSERVFGEGDYLRPGMIQFYESDTVLLADYTIVDSPFWVNHLVYTRDGCATRPGQHRGLELVNVRMNGIRCSSVRSEPTCWSGLENSEGRHRDVIRVAAHVVRAEWAILGSNQ